MTKVAVIGIGQSLRGDDAAGLEAIRQWQKRFQETASRPEVRVEASELPGLALIDMLRDADAAILVDAIQSPAKPGTIHRLNEDELLSFASDSKSAHGWGIAETLAMARLLDRIEDIPIRVVGIEAEQFALGTAMSAAVQESIPSACKAIQEEIEAFIIG